MHNKEIFIVDQLENCQFSEFRLLLAMKFSRANVIKGLLSTYHFDFVKLGFAICLLYWNVLVCLYS